MTGSTGVQQKVLINEQPCDLTLRGWIHVRRDRLTPG